MVCRTAKFNSAPTYLSTLGVNHYFSLNFNHQLNNLNSGDVFQDYKIRNSKIVYVFNTNGGLVIATLSKWFPITD